MTQTEAINYWFESATRNREAANDNFKTGHYDWALFLWHLTLEKTIKGIVTKSGNVPPPTHDLRKLLSIANILLNESQQEEVKEINTFSLEARYDDYKLSFYKKATKEYAELWIHRCEQLYVWFKQH